MKFKNWMLDEINAGVARNFRSQHPHLPQYVATQVLHNRVAPLWRNLSAGQAPTMATGLMDKNDTSKDNNNPPPATTTDPSFSKKHPIYKTLGQVYDDPKVRSITQNQNWQEKVINLSPLDFTPNTVRMFLSHNFGSSPSLGSEVRAHDSRMQVQGQKAVERGQGGNEPIVMIQHGDKYDMQEGWHRLYSYLLQYSAPPEERQKVLSGQANVDLNKWRPVQIKAWIGTNPESAA